MSLRKVWLANEFFRVQVSTRKGLRMSPKTSPTSSVNPEYSLEGLMLKVKLQYFGRPMGRAASLEKTLMPGKIEGGNMRWLDGVTNSVDMSSSKPVVGSTAGTRKWQSREASCLHVPGQSSQRTSLALTDSFKGWQAEEGRAYSKPSLPLPPRNGLGVPLHCCEYTEAHLWQECS